MYELAREFTSGMSNVQTWKLSSSGELTLANNKALAVQALPVATCTRRTGAPVP